METATSFPGSSPSRSLERSREREGEDPGNEVVETEVPAVLCTHRAAIRGKTNTTDNYVKITNMVGITTLQERGAMAVLVFPTTSAEIRLSPNVLSRENVI